MCSLSTRQEPTVQEDDSEVDPTGQADQGGRTVQEVDPAVNSESRSSLEARQESDKGKTSPEIQPEVGNGEADPQEGDGEGRDPQEAEQDGDSETSPEV